MDRDEPVSTSEAAELRVLEIALAERAGRGAPDAWPAIAARLAAGGAVVAPRRRSRLLVAAMALLGLGVVIATAMWREAPAPRVATPLRGKADDPRTLAELQERIRVARRANVMATGVWSDELRRWVDLERWPLDSLFTSGTSPALSAELQAALVAAMEGASVDGDAAVQNVVWTHRLNLPSAESVDQGRGGVLLLRVGGGQPTRLAFRSPDGAVGLSCPALPLVQLQPLLDEAVEVTVRELGYAIGAGGLARLPDGASRMHLIDVPERAVGELQRFSRLNLFDLRRAPEWHVARVLDGLAATPVHSLMLTPRWLDGAAYAALGRLGKLRELFLCEGDPWAFLAGDVVVEPMASLDDAALGSLGGLGNLHEVSFVGGVFSDQGLRRLAAVPLRTLNLLGCSNVRGAGFAALGSLDRLMVRGGRLAADVTSVLAAMPKLRVLHLADCGAPALAPLANAPALEELGLVEPLSNLRIQELAGLNSIESLRLDLTPRPGVGDLRPLAAMKGLKRLTLAGVDEGVCVQLREVLAGCRISRDD